MHKMPLVVLASFFLLAAQSAVAAPHHKDCRPLWHKDRAAFKRYVQGNNGKVFERLTWGKRSPLSEL